LPADQGSKPMASQSSAADRGLTAPMQLSWTHRHKSHFRDWHQDQAASRVPPHLRKVRDARQVVDVLLGHVPLVDRRQETLGDGVSAIVSL
jgi:hypothetical protein